MWRKETKTMDKRFHKRKWKMSAYDIHTHMARFTQTVIDVTGLTGTEIEFILAQGIKSVEDLSLFKDKDIDHLFQTPGLKTVPLMTQLKLKGLAEVLRVRRGRGRLSLDITQLDVDLKLRERSRREAYHWWYF
jgi:ubiquinone/menaquinone biosynthesis C-methylase UbiE